MTFALDEASAHDAPAVRKIERIPRRTNGSRRSFWNREERSISDAARRK
jgi:hypothetical protein